MARNPSLTLRLLLDDEPHRNLATRVPRRPNPIGISIARLVRVEGLTLRVEDVDVVDGTPMLAIKPYVSAFDVRKATSIGWLEENVDRVRDVRVHQC